MAADSSFSMDDIPTRPIRPSTSSEARNIRARNWCFTVYGSPSDDLEITWHTLFRLFPVSPNFVKYRIVGLENCPTTGRQHLQCYVSFVKQLRLSDVKKLFPDDLGVHWEISREPPNRPPTTARRMARFSTRVVIFRRLLVVFLSMIIPLSLLVLRLATLTTSRRSSSSAATTLS